MVSPRRLISTQIGVTILAVFEGVAFSTIGDGGRKEKRFVGYFLVFQALYLACALHDTWVDVRAARGGACLGVPRRASTDMTQVRARLRVAELVADLHGRVCYVRRRGGLRSQASRLSFSADDSDDSGRRKLFRKLSSVARGFRASKC